MVTLHEVITFLVSMQISISSLQTHNVNRCGRSRHLARKLSLRRKRSSPNVFEMAATETITSIILIKLIRVSLGTVRHPRRFKIVVIDIQITLKQMLRDFIGIRVNRAKKSGMVNITSSVNSRERSGINTILHEIGRAVQQECRDRSRMPSSARKKKCLPAAGEQRSTRDPRVGLRPAAEPGAGGARIPGGDLALAG